MGRRAPLRHRVLYPFALAVERTGTLTEAIKHLRYWFVYTGTRDPLLLKKFVLPPQATASCCRLLRRVHARPALSWGLGPEDRLDRQGFFEGVEST